MRLPALIVLVLAGAGCAPADPSGLGVDADLASGRCFRAGQIHTFHVADRVAYVRSNQGDVYRLAAPGSCFDAGTASLTVEPYLGVSERLCVGEEARVRVTRTASTPLTCVARVEGPITDSSVSGLPARQR